MNAAIVIVAYNSGDVIGACLDSCRKVCPQASIIVVDNASSDSTCEQVRKRTGVHLMANTDNRGFAAAANQGFRAAGADCVLLLNPDVALQSGIDGLIEACANGAAAAGGKLIGEDGRPQAGFMVRRIPTPAALALEALGINRLWPSNPVNTRYRCLDLDPDVAAEVEQPAGAFLMVRRDVWEKLGGFDERFYPLWFEDVDFCKRIREARYTIWYVPTVLARHLGGCSVRRLGRQQRYLFWYLSLLKWAAKHFRRNGRAVVCMGVLLGSLPRMLAGIIGERNLQPVAAGVRVIRLAFLCMCCGRVQGVAPAASYRGRSVVG